MTTHVFIVNTNTLKVHLDYMFVGTGADNKNVDFNNSSTSYLHYSSEDGLTAMMADGCRMRKDDFVIFYLQATNNSEGKFYGIFQISADCIFLEKSENQYLIDNLGKSLIFRQIIRPFEIYSKGVTEWEALDEIKNIQAPCQMLWSLIYRKLKGNRGNTMLTIYEAERLFGLIRKKNNNKKLNGLYFTFKGDEIVNGFEHQYSGSQIEIDILPRLIAKYEANKAHEVQLQMYITQNIGRRTNISLDKSLGIDNEEIEWIGNEVSCGVGMQRIDIMISLNHSKIEKILMPIELKAVSVNNFNINQIKRYITWIEQYYIPNRASTIQPVLICKKCTPISRSIKNAFISFNNSSDGRYLPLKYIEYEIMNRNIDFYIVDY